MKTLERGTDKIQKICDKIRQDTIDPAQQEAEVILKEARAEAAEILRQAQLQAEEIFKEAKTKIEQENNVFHSALKQAAKQAIEALRQEIEKNFFNQEIHDLLGKELTKPTIIADLIKGLVKAIEKEGIDTDLTAIIPHLVSSEEVIRLLMEEVRQKLKDQPFELGRFAGGAQVKLVGKKMTLDLSNKVIEELLATYMRKDFRQLVFSH